MPLTRSEITEGLHYSAENSPSKSIIFQHGCVFADHNIQAQPQSE